MTIASAFNEIAVAQGGTASSSGTIAGAIDALTDALAGSDVQSPSTIEGAVRLLGEHIGGGGGSLNVGDMVRVEIWSGNTELTTAFCDVSYGDTYLSFSNGAVHTVAAGLHVVVGDEDLTSSSTATIRYGSGTATPIEVKLSEFFESYIVEFDLPIDMTKGQTVTVKFTA